MSRDLTRYNNGKAITRASKPENAIVSFVGRTLGSVGIGYDDANRRGRIKQIEADMILEYELGLRPRRKK